MLISFVICSMFTGIVESVGRIREIIPNGSNKSFWIESPLSSGFKIDQSVSHSGVCLTIEETHENLHRVTAIEETLKKTNLDSWESAGLVNLEQCLRMNGRIDGHLVQGHADCVAYCTDIVEKNGSREIEFEFPKEHARLIVEKGSICVEGISLTAFRVKKKRFTVALIPYTLEHTNIRNISIGSPVNLEFDIIGKYIAKLSKF